MKKQTKSKIQKTEQELYYEAKNRLRHNIKEFLIGIGYVIGLLAAGVLVIGTLVGGFMFFCQFEDFLKLKRQVKELEARPTYPECSTCKRIEDEKWGQPRVEGRWSQYGTNFSYAFTNK